MATVRRFEDLECWQEARAFVRLIYGLTKKNHFQRDFELVKQVRKSAVSSMGNIAEGFHRNSSKDFMRFLDYSRASVAETVSHAYVALDQEYISKDEMVSVREMSEVVWRKVNGFIAYLRQSQSRKRPTNRTNQTNKTNSTNPTNRTSKTN